MAWIEKSNCEGVSALADRCIRGVGFESLGPLRFEVYREISRHIRTNFAEPSAIIEPLSLDEACLDVTESDPRHRVG